MCLENSPLKWRVLFNYVDFVNFLGIFSSWILKIVGLLE